MLRMKYFSLIAIAALGVFATGCIVNVEPDRATNPVGTEHTVTLTLRDPEESTEVFCDVIEDVFDEIEEEFPNEEIPAIPVPIACLDNVDTAVPIELQLIIFEVISGPNAGQSSLIDGVCEPSCATLQEETSWTYRSNGIPGTDTIVACVNYLEVLDEIFGSNPSTALSEEEAIDLLEELIVDAVNDALGTDYDTFQDFFCQTVQKTWVDRSDRPNIGAGLSGLFQGQPTALPMAPAPVAAAPNQGIRPPNTGDAGLR